MRPAAGPNHQVRSRISDRRGINNRYFIERTALSHQMVEGDGPDAWENSIARICNERVNVFSLSRRTGEGRGEGLHLPGSPAMPLPASQPVVQAAWKLYPPVTPSISSNSPAK